MRKLYWLAGAILFLQGELAFSQSLDKIYITARYDHVPLREVISDLQKTHSLKFFFVDQQIDSVRVTARINNQVLEQALRIILNNSYLSFYFDQNKKIVLYVDEKRITTKVPIAKNIFSIRGTVTDAATNTPIPSASVYIQSIQTGCVSDANGTFIMRSIPQGVYVIQSSYLGFMMHEQKVVLHNDVDLDISLMENATELAAVEITAALYEINLSEPSSHTLSSAEIFHSPNLANDISRTLRVLPGIASNDYSAKPRIRGGSADESVFYLDNFEIISPFHFEEFDGLFSIINTDYISNVKVIPGGFSPAYTDKIAGVIDISAPGTVEQNKGSFSLDLINTKFFLTRKLNDKLDVQFSARRTYLDLVLGLNKSKTIQVDPVYYDLWSKVNYRINEKNRLAFNILHSTDVGKTKIREASHNWIDMNGTRNNDYFWVNWKNTARANYQQITTAGYQRLAKTSNFDFTNTLSEHNVDDRVHNVLVLSHTSFQEIGARNHLEFGGDVKHFLSHLAFNEIRFNTFESTREKTIIDTIDVDSRFTSTLGGLYAQNTFDVSQKFYLTAGARLSYFNSANNAVLLAPRVGASFKFNEKLTLKMGYGIYNQAAYPVDARIYVGEQFPMQGDKQSIHYTASVLYTSKNTSLILNGYYKDNKKLYDDYRYDVFNRLGGGISILDQSFITTSGYSEGIEAIVRHRYGKGSILTASYAYAVNKIRNSAGLEAYRDNDRRHTLLINSLMALKNNWTFSVYSIFYTGEPYTPTTVNFVGESDEREILFFNLGPKNSKRLRAFYSLDMRIDKFWYFRKWNLNVYLNIINTTSHTNVRNYFWVPWSNDAGNYNASKVEEWYLSTIFVSPGISIGF